MAAPKKILQKRNKNQAETIADLTDENERLVAEWNQFADLVVFLQENNPKVVKGLEAAGFGPIIEKATIIQKPKG